MKMSNSLEKAGKAALDFDARTQAVFKPFASTRLVEALNALSKLADQPQLRTLAGALILAAVFTRNHRLARAGSRMIIAHEAATFAKDMIKTEVDRTRPRSADSRLEKKPRKGRHESKELTSFPSGHSAGAMATACAFAREYPEYGPAAVGGAALIALLQIPRCAHYPTDVATGLAIGLGAEQATNRLWNAAGLKE